MMPKPKRMAKPKAVLFDLLTALIDSWTLWDSVAGNLGDGRRWRAAYLKITYAQGRYRAYENLVREAAEAVGLAPKLGDRLVERFSELAPWPEVNEVVGALEGNVLLGIVTNCSEALGQLATARTGAPSTQSSRRNGRASISRICARTGSLSMNSV